MFTLLGLIAVGAGLATGSTGGAGLTADQALEKLMAGNRHFVESKLSCCGQLSPAAREGLATSQKPYAVIVSCSDSRVPPELIFDKSLGEIFVVRVAGNAADPMVVGSVEYAAEHLGAPLVMVLGHERCGAVTAAVEAKGKAEGNIGAIVRAITPAVYRAKNMCIGCETEKAKFVEAAVDENTKLVASNLMRQSKVLSNLAKEGKLKIVSAKYDLDDGKVTIFDAGKK